MGDLFETLEAKHAFDLSSPRDIEVARVTLASGPARFLPKQSDRTIQEQLNSLTERQRSCFDYLVDKWDELNPEDGIPDELVLRYARNSPSGKNGFDRKSSWKQMRKIKKGSKVVRQLNLSVKSASMRKQLLSKTLFPLPGLCTAEGHEVFYMRPSRFTPKETSTSKVLDNLAYCMNTMTEREAASRDGIGFVANMDGWTMKNYGSEYCLKFMQCLQGHRVPVRVTLFLIVNPPRWFNKVWEWMKPMLSDEFRKRVHMVPESKLDEYLAPGFQNYMPDEMVCGKVKTDELVRDFVAFRTLLECPVPVQEQQALTLDSKSSHTDEGTKKAKRKTLKDEPKRRKKKDSLFSKWMGSTDHLPAVVS